MIVLMVVEVKVCAVAGLAITTSWGDGSDISTGGVACQGRNGLHTFVAIDADTVVDKKRVVCLVAGTDTFRRVKEISKASSAMVSVVEIFLEAV